MPSRARLGLLLVVTVLAASLLADELTDIKISDYRRLKFESVNPDAYRRALERIKTATIGMRVDEFFEKMAMLIVKDKKGQGIDAFVDGYLQAESAAESEKVKPASVLLFGYYQNWKKRKDPVVKFRVVLRDNVFTELAFVDPADDWRSGTTP